ncbi:MAG: cytochrome c [Caulobacteraceae bacterium]
MTVRGLTLAALLVAPILAACADIAGRGDRNWGLQIATANCARCHAIGTSGNSPNAFAPPLRQLRKHYAVATLNATFTSHTLVGHAPMPNFAARTDDIADLLAYVQSIQESDSPSWPKPPFAQCGVGAIC